MLGRKNQPPVDWVIEDTIGNWWRPNFENLQVVNYADAIINDPSDFIVIAVKNLVSYCC